MKNSDCLAPCITMMKYTGVWRPDNLSYPWDTVYLVFGTLFQVVMFYFIVLAEIGHLVNVLGDTEHSVDATVLLLSHLVQGIKVLNITFKQKRIKRLINFIDGPKFRKSDAKKQAIIDRTTRLTTFGGQILIFSSMVTALFWCIVPALKSEVTLPLKTAYPFDISGYMFYIMYAYCAIAVTVVGMGDTAENYLVAGLLLLARAQLEVLCEELKDIDQSDDEPSFNKTKSCIKYHQNIIKYVDQIAALFSFAIFCQFTTSSVVICMTLFKISIVQEPMEMITIIFYLVLVFCELLMYCCPGELLINKSLEVSVQAYPSFKSGDQRSWQALLLMSLRGQRSLAIHAGTFHVSLSTAAAVVQTAYSYYAVLRQKANSKVH